MDITRRAIRRIRQIKERQGVSKGTGLRLRLKEGSIYLGWDPSGPRDEDLVVARKWFPIFINAQAYPQLADYVLDYEHDKDAARFVLRPGPGMTKGKSRWEARTGRRAVKRGNKS